MNRQSPEDKVEMVHVMSHMHLDETADTKRRIVVAQEDETPADRYLVLEEEFDKVEPLTFKEQLQQLHLKRLEADHKLKMFIAFSLLVIFTLFNAAVITLCFIRSFGVEPLSDQVVLALIAATAAETATDVIAMVKYSFQHQEAIIDLSN